jgi:flagellar hook assembly protein FlgD
VTALARAVFGALVVASFAAFFVAQRLKHSPALVQSVIVTPTFAPTGPPSRRLERISFHIKATDYVTVRVLDSRGRRVATLARARLQRAYRRLSLTWNGRTDSGRPAPAGTYQLRVTLRLQARSVLLPQTFMLVTPPGQIQASARARAPAGPGARAPA